MVDGRYLIAVSTYRRPDGIYRLLRSIRASTEDADILVVDNDPAGSGRSSVEAAAVGAIYVLEKEAGIASARNRALAHFDARYSGIIFVDDDEWVSAGWFETLTRYAADSDADVVSGPVTSVIPEDAPRWMIRGGFFQRPLFATGLTLKSAATNNTLLERSAWERAGYPIFDVEFSSTGGSDWEFFWGIAKHGATLLYCAEAQVFEDVPQSRLNFKWIRNRAIRSGIVNIRVLRKYNEPLARPVARSAARLGFNLLKLVGLVAIGRGIQAAPLNAVLLEFGKIAALFGLRIHEYKRVD